jgi:hypothetical protein
MLFNNSVRTSKRTPHFTITKINWLTLFKEIIAVYAENHAKSVNKKCSVTNCKISWYTWLPFGFKRLTHGNPSNYAHALLINTHETGRHGIKTK